MIGWHFDNTYARLPSGLFSSAVPVQVRAPRVAILNHRLAEELGLNLRDLPESEAAALLAGQTLPDGSQPIAQAYAGHQFGGFTILGDGRAILLGEHCTPDGRRYDIQFKGSGPTPYSRGGDGRAALGPMLREYIISEAMHALGIPTTQSLAVVTSGEKVWRDRPLPGAVLTRVAASHIRVGTFQYLAARGDDVNLRILADYTIARHYTELTEQPQTYLAFLRAVIDRQASLIARWQQVGFVHGVMNTDNMAISGETIDYGPCAFLDAYHEEMVFSSIDEGGRYAYGNQPRIAQWNLVRFAETILPLIDAVPENAIALATEAINEYSDLYMRYWLDGMRLKLGLATEEPEDVELVRSLLGWMQATGADFTITFRGLRNGESANLADEQFRAWHARWQSRLDRENRPREEVYAAMDRINPAVISRNHHVEAALAAAENDDWSVLHELLSALATPYDAGIASAKFCDPAPPGSRRYRTFCGT